MQYLQAVTLLNTLVPYQDCGSTIPLTKLEVYPPCDPNQCVVTRGEPSLLIADFIPDSETNNLRVHVLQIDPNFQFETMLWPEFGVCNKTGIVCPTEPSRVVAVFVPGESAGDRVDLVSPNVLSNFSNIPLVWNNVEEPKDLSSLSRTLTLLKRKMTL